MEPALYGFLGACIGGLFVLLGAALQNWGSGKREKADKQLERLESFAAALAALAHAVSRRSRSLARALEDGISHDSGRNAEQVDEILLGSTRIAMHAGLYFKTLSKAEREVQDRLQGFLDLDQRISSGGPADAGAVAAATIQVRNAINDLLREIDKMVKL